MGLEWLCGQGKINTYSWDDGVVYFCECVLMCEEIIGRHLWGHVSRTGLRSTSVKSLYDMNAPFVETLEQATHFKRGPEVYAGAIYPWKEPITSPYRDRVEQGLPSFEVDGDWPWNEDFFPKPSAIHGTGQP